MHAAEILQALQIQRSERLVGVGCRGPIQIQLSIPVGNRKSQVEKVITIPRTLLV
jgi:hypothetical protein